MFELSRSQKEIQKAAREFARGEFDKEMTLELETKREYPVSIWEKAAELGFIGIQYPEKYSGGGMGLLENCIIAEELCKKDSTMGFVLTLAGFGSECVFRFGEEALKEKYLPMVAEGEKRAGVAFAETEKGDDLSKVSTKAVLSGGEWIINGKKKYVINVGNGSFYVVLCRTDPDADIKKGVSMILVEGSREGVSFSDMGKKLGANMMPSFEMTLENVRVPASNLLGKEGKGIVQAKSFFDEARILGAARSVGIAQGAMDRALVYIKQREQFDRKIAVFQIIRHKIAEMATKVELARLITHEAAWSFDNKKFDTRLASMAKLYAAKAAVQVADDAVQLLGGYGYMVEAEVEKYLRDAKISQLWLGTPDTQRDDISSLVIGKLKG